MGKNPLSQLIFRGASLAFLAKVIFTGTSFVITSITALWYGADVVGVVATMTAVATLLGIAANGGTSTSINTLVATRFATGAMVGARLAYGRIITICVLGGLGLGGALLLSSLLGGGIGVDESSGVSPSLVLVLVACAVIFRVLSEMTSFAMRALDQILGFAILTVSPVLINLAVLLAGRALGYGAQAAVWGYALGLGGGALLGLLWVRARIRAVPARTAELDVPEIPAILRYSFPMLISTVGAYIVTGSGLILLSYFSSDADTGIFAVAIRLATVTSLILTSINAITTPIFARLYDANDIEQLVDVARRTSRMMFWAVVPVIAGLAIAGRPLMVLAFGPEFEAAYLPMMILLAGQLVNVATGPSDFLMNMAGLQRALRNIITPAALCSVLLGVLLIPGLGGVGAALAYAICLTCWKIAAAVVLRRRFGVWIFYIPFLSRW